MSDEKDEHKDQGDVPDSFGGDGGTATRTQRRPRAPAIRVALKESRPRRVATRPRPKAGRTLRLRVAQSLRLGVAKRLRRRVALGPGQGESLRPGR